MTKQEFSDLIIKLIDDLGFKQKTISDRTKFDTSFISNAYNRKYKLFAVRSGTPETLFEAFPDLKKAENERLDKQIADLMKRVEDLQMKQEEKDQFWQEVVNELTEQLKYLREKEKNNA